MAAVPTEDLIRVACDASSTPELCNAAAAAFLQAVMREPVERASEEMQKLGRQFGFPDPTRAAFLALVCGAMVEKGADPNVVAEPLIARLHELVHSAAAIVNRCTVETDDEDADPSERFEAERQKLAVSFPKENADWEALDVFWRPAIAVFSRSPQARATARPLRDQCLQISNSCDAGHWLQLMLSVLDAEPILVIEPATRQGITGRMSGVVDNFQLNMLLMDIFPRINSAPRISREAADIARGIGPQESDEVITGAWNLHDWRAIQAGYKLPNHEAVSSDFWIWNEGTPSDIPRFDGHRVVLLGCGAQIERLTSSCRTSRI